MPKLRLPEVRLAGLLKLIHRYGQVPRSQLAEKTGFSTFLISNLVDRLLTSNYVTEIGSGDSTGGRRPKLLAVRAGLGRLVGIDLGTVNVRVVVTDAAGNVLAYEREPSHVAEGPDQAMSHLINLIETSLKRAGVASDELWGIGLGLSAILDRASGATLFWPKAPQWANVPVRRLLADRFGVPVEVEDSARTMALAERRFGAAAKAREFIYILLGVGMGSALFLNGELYTGSGGFAGEFGHMTIDPNGPWCSCGNRGCIEALASAAFLVQRGREAVTSGLSSKLSILCEGKPENVTIEQIVQAARQQDRFSVNLLVEAGMNIGIGIVGLVNLLDPELIVLGGGLACATADIILPAIQRLVQERAVERGANTVQVQVSTLQDVDWARGAMLAISEQVLETRFLSSLRTPRPPSRREPARKSLVL